jgi:hypothetical protein
MSGDTLLPGAGLLPGQDCTSSSGNARFTLQGDGNLVLYVKRVGVRSSSDPGWHWAARWASNTAGRPAARCVMQGDGNLVIYDGQNRALWASGTVGNANVRLVVQDDENVVIYLGSHALWSTNSWVAAPARTSFSAAGNGFRFTNDFPDGYWNIGPVKFASHGLCGGMSFAALDYYFAGKPVPETATTPSATSDPLGTYIDARQQQSVAANFGHWTTMLTNPDDHALAYWSTHDEWNKLKAGVAANHPVPIGLGLYMNGASSHQVVGTGYQEGAQERWIWTYDPDWPGSEGYVYLPPGQLHWQDEIREQDPNWPTWRGFFVSDYTPQSAP